MTKSFLPFCLPLFNLVVFNDKQKCLHFHIIKNTKRYICVFFLDLDLNRIE